MSSAKKIRQPSGVNALRALELLVDHQQGLGIAAMGRELGMDGAQCHRLVNGLKSAGYVSKTAASPSRYVVTPKVLRLAAKLLANSELIQVSQPIMVRLRDEVGETVHLAAMFYGVAISVARQLSRQHVGVITHIGESWTVNEGAVGLVAGAFGPNSDEVDGDLRRRHVQILERGFAHDQEEVMRGVVGFAAPIFDLANQLVGALAIAGPSERVTGEHKNGAHLGGKITEAAAEVSSQLGWLGDGYSVLTDRYGRQLE